MGNPHLGRGRVVASDSDSSDDDNDYPRPTQQQQRAQEEMAGIAMQDLGSHTRDQVTSTDTGPRQPFVTDRWLNTVRRANNEGTEEYQVAQNHQESTNSWNGFQLVAPRDHEELPDINGGNSHRSNMMRNIEEQRARMGGQTDWDALDDGHRRGGFPRSGRGRAGGRGDRPLDPAVDPNRSYGYKIKGKPITAGSAANAFRGPVGPAHKGGHSNISQGHASAGGSSVSLKSTAKTKAMPLPPPTKARTGRHEIPAWLGELAQNETVEDVAAAQQKSMLSAAMNVKPGHSATAPSQDLSPLVSIEPTKSTSPAPASTLATSNIDPTSGAHVSTLGSPSAFLAYANRGTFNRKAYGQPTSGAPVAAPIAPSTTQFISDRATDATEIRRVPISEFRLAPPEDATAFTDGGPSPASLGSDFTASATSVSTSGLSSCIPAIAPIPEGVGLGISMNRFNGLIANPPSPERPSRIALTNTIKERNTFESASQSTVTHSTKKVPMFVEVNGQKYVLANAIPADKLPPSESPEKPSDPAAEKQNLLLDNGYILSASLLDTSVPEAEVSKTAVSYSRPATKRKSTVQESRWAKGKSPPQTSPSTGFGAGKKTVNPFEIYGRAPFAAQALLPLQPVSGNVPINSPPKGGSLVGDSHLFPGPQKPENPFSAKDQFTSGTNSLFQQQQPLSSTFTFKPSTHDSNHTNVPNRQSPRKGIKRTNAGPGYDWILAEMDKARLRGGQGAGLVQQKISGAAAEPPAESKPLFAMAEKDGENNNEEVEEEDDDDEKDGKSEESSEL